MMLLRSKLSHSNFWSFLISGGMVLISAQTTCKSLSVFMLNTSFGITFSGLYPMSKFSSFGRRSTIRKDVEERKGWYLVKQVV